MVLRLPALTEPYSVRVLPVDPYSEGLEVRAENLIRVGQLQEQFFRNSSKIIEHTFRERLVFVTLPEWKSIRRRRRFTRQATLSV